MGPRTLRTADIIASQLQSHNGGLLEEVTGAVTIAEPDACAAFEVTDNDGIRYRVLVTPVADAGPVTDVGYLSLPAEVQDAVETRAAEDEHRTGLCDYHGGRIHRAVTRWDHWFCSEACAQAWDRERQHKRTGRGRVASDG